MSNGLFLDTGREVAKRYPDIQFDDMIVDATAMKLVIAPERFDVIVTMNLFGDILSDLTAGLVGGLGVAPAANIGDGGCAMFEAVHGTAPDIAGKGIANPTGLMLSAAMLLDHVEQRDAAERLRKGICAALGECRDAHRRPRRQGEHGAVHRRRDPRVRLVDGDGGDRREAVIQALDRADRGVAECGDASPRRTPGVRSCSCSARNSWKRSTMP